MKTLLASFFVLHFAIMTNILAVTVAGFAAATGPVENDLNGKPVFRSPIIQAGPSEEMYLCKASDFYYSDKCASGVFFRKAGKRCSR